jgi:hypothetical protein
LPGDAQDIYYRDEIGNISTSNVAARQSRLEVELRPRFPLFGGWHTNYGFTLFNFKTYGQMQNFFFENFDFFFDLKILFFCLFFFVYFLDF